MKTLAELIQDFGDEIISENLKRIKDEYKSLYWIWSYSLKDESSLSYVRELCDGVKDFYFQVADRNNNIIINIC